MMSFSYFPLTKTSREVQVCQDVWRSAPMLVNLLFSENYEAFLPFNDLAKSQSTMHILKVHNLL